MTWSLPDELVEHAAMTQPLRKVGAADYEDLWRWSVEDIERFWRTIWAALRHCGRRRSSARPCLGMDVTTGFVGGSPLMEVRPGEIIAVPDAPRTLTGELLELPVKKLLMGQDGDAVTNRDALANSDAYEWFVAFAKEHGPRVRTNRPPRNLSMK